jgi:hypothetical protein
MWPSRFCPAAPVSGAPSALASLACAQREVLHDPDLLLYPGHCHWVQGSDLLARRLSKPIQQLVTGVTEVAVGNTTILWADGTR